MIKHALTREVAYGSLLKAKRAPLHAGFAEWLERNAKDEDEHAPLLAHHYAEAVLPEDLDVAWPGREQHAEALRAKAVLWSRRAADLAIGRYEIDEGLALLRRAVSLEPEPAGQAAIWQRIGQACALKYDGEGFWQAMRQALDIGGPSAEVYADLALETNQRAGMWVKEPDMTLLDGWAEQAMELRGRLADPGEGVRRADVDPRRRSATRLALAIADRLGDIGLRCTSLSDLLQHRPRGKDFDRACALMDEVMALLPALNDPNSCFVICLSRSSCFCALATSAPWRGPVLWPPRPRLGSPRITACTQRPGRSCCERGRRWVEAPALAAEADRVVDADLAAATPCVFNVSILLNCAPPASMQATRTRAAGWKAERRGSAWKAAGGTGLVRPPQIRLALARHDRRTRGSRPPEVDSDLEPVSTFLDPLTASATVTASRRRPPSGCNKDRSPSHSRCARSVSPAVTGHCHAGAGAIRGDGPHLARGADSAHAVTASARPGMITFRWARTPPIATATCPVRTSTISADTSPDNRIRTHPRPTAPRTGLRWTGCGIESKSWCQQSDEEASLCSNRFGDRIRTLVRRTMIGRLPICR